MTKEELRQSEKDLLDKNCVLSAANIKLRNELSKATEEWGKEKVISARLRNLLIHSARSFHQINCEDIPMSACSHPQCVAATKEM